MAVPFVLAPHLQPGLAEPMSPRITRLIANNPGPFTYTGSGTYLLHGEGETVVIDPGPGDRAHQERLVETATSPIRHILITHTHSDHCGGAAMLQALTGATSYAFGAHPSEPGEASPALEEGADFAFSPDRLVRDGERLSLAGLTIEAVHTPGHIGNHLCFALLEESVLFTGDHVMGWSTTVVAPPDGDMAAYRASLERLLQRSDQRYYPTHGAPIEAPHAFVRALIAHREARDQAILAVLRKGPAEPEEIVAEVYKDLPEGLVFAAALNVTAHLEAHEAAGRVTKNARRYQLSSDVINPA